MEHAKVLHTETCRKFSSCHVMTYQLVGPYRHSPRSIFNHLLSLVGDQKGERDVGMTMQSRRGSAPGWGSGRVIASRHYSGVVMRLQKCRAATISRHRLSAMPTSWQCARSTTRYRVQCGPRIHGGHRANTTQASDK